MVESPSRKFYPFTFMKYDLFAVGRQSWPYYQCHEVVTCLLAYVSVMMDLELHCSQQANDVEMTSYWRRCDVITSHRRQYDVIFGVACLLGCDCPASTWANKPALSMSTDYRNIGSLSKIIEDSCFFDIFIGLEAFNWGPPRQWKNDN